MAEKKEITLIIGEKELKFGVGITDYNRYINELDTNNKIVPTKRFLRETLADRKDMETLDDLMNQGLALDLMGEIIKDFRPDVEITVKK